MIWCTYSYSHGHSHDHSHGHAPEPVAIEDADEWGEWQNTMNQMNSGGGGFMMDENKSALDNFLQMDIMKQCLIIFSSIFFAGGLFYLRSYQTSIPGIILKICGSKIWFILLTTILNSHPLS